MHEFRRNKTLVLGLDGASFNFIKEWIDQDLLPNFQELMERGSSGDLESCLPPVTMPAWRVYSTGKYPGKLGIYWHQQLDMNSHKVITPNATMVKSADHWDYLNKAGIRSGIVGMPDLYPPRSVDGFVVCGGPSASWDNLTYPESWGSKLENDINYEFCLMGDFSGANESSPIVQEALDVLEKTFRGAEYIYQRDPVDYLQVVLFDINRIQHFFYDSDPTLRAWQIADKWLGDLSSQFDYIFILSDHGTERLERAFFLNVWLKQNGYLSTRFKPMDALPMIGINRTTLGRIAKFFNLRRFLDFEAVRKYSSILPAATGVFGEFGNQAVLDRLEWGKTRAIALAQGPIYINRELIPDDCDYLKFREELVEKLESLVEPLSGKKVFKKVFLKEDIYTGPYLDQAPDLLALNHDEFHNRAGLNQPTVFANQWAWKGNNRLNGLFMAAGPGIRPGYIANGVRIVDLAPTILHINNVPIPDDMDGKVIEEIFDPQSELARRPIRFQEPIYYGESGAVTDTFDEVVETRLRDLGYLE